MLFVTGGGRATMDIFLKQNEFIIGIFQTFLLFTLTKSEGYFL
jgi:hypothetical protein